MELFHKIALEEFYKAILEAKEQDSNYVKWKVYERYEKDLAASNLSARMAAMEAKDGNNLRN